MRGFLKVSFLSALLAGATFVAAPPAAAHGSYSPYNETASAALARYVRNLASDPKDFDSLIGAGRAALELGDTQAAAGFFARADEINPRSPLPQAGMGAVSVDSGNAKGAMPYFTRAQQLGATPAMLGCDRGLAYDMLGQQAQAQADYRAALSGADADEARRRLALSLAISGDKANALATLAPMSASGDATTTRVRAFILALTGDSNAAMTAVDAAMPGSWASVAPFLQRLPSLAAGQKAAAVNLGIFPDANAPIVSYASTTPPPAPPVRPAAPPQAPRVVASVTTDRLTGIDALLRGTTASPAPPQPVWEQPRLPQNDTSQPIRLAYNPSPAPSVVQRTQSAPQIAAVQAHKVWLQLASGQNANALSGEFRRMKSRNKDVFEGIRPYLAKSGDRSRLVIGPFRGPLDADILADDLHTVGIDAFRWSNSESDEVVPLASE